MHFTFYIFWIILLLDFTFSHLLNISIIGFYIFLKPSNCVVRGVLDCLHPRESQCSPATPRCSQLIRMRVLSPTSAYSGLTTGALQRDAFRNRILTKEAVCYCIYTFVSSFYVIPVEQGYHIYQKYIPLYKHYKEKTTKFSTDELYSVHCLHIPSIFTSC